ncbi:hypothetical protein OV079_19780 [Nannocystis pusilla]|uniref:Uncharacterized protein n=1 Tax=Nannocystis pusilla TaxID=889268 RepID=A0A9X3IXR7_9BACT|nr:hypothetical protein [Nannocystis pusilla]MCY1007751.1 hypothetical protein [Nannocystis pusilla]
MLALAAAIALWRFTVSQPSPALTGYSVTVRNSTLQELRGDEPAAAAGRYRPDTELDWVISPERTVAGAVELRALARAPDGRSELLAPPFTRTPAGALRIRGRLDAVLLLAAGRWRLTLLVAPEGAAPARPTRWPRRSRPAARSRSRPRSRSRSSRPIRSRLTCPNRHVPACICLRTRRSRRVRSFGHVP